MQDSDIHSVIGDDGFGCLVAAFYRRVPHDEILGQMYPRQELKEAEQRLRDFLIFRFGGPPRYIEQRGHPQLRMRHARFQIGDAARDRWVQLMNAALDETKLPSEVDQVLRAFFEATATFLINERRDSM